MKTSRRSASRAAARRWLPTALLAVPAGAGAHATVSPFQPQTTPLTAARTSYVRAGAEREERRRTPTRSRCSCPTALQEVISVKQAGDWSVRLRRRDTGKKNEDGDPLYAITSISWIAKKGSEIKPGFFGEFFVRLQNPVQPGKFCFPINQYYRAKGFDKLSKRRSAARSPSWCAWTGPSERGVPGVLRHDGGGTAGGVSRWRLAPPHSGHGWRRALRRALPARLRRAGAGRAGATQAFGHAVVQPSASRPAEQQVYTLTVPSERSSDVVAVSMQVPPEVESLIVRKAPGWKVRLQQRGRPGRGRALDGQPHPARANTTRSSSSRATPSSRARSSGR